MNKEVVTTRTAKIFQITDEILKVEVKEFSNTDEADAKENHEACKKLANGRKMAILIDSRTVTTATPEAREYSASDVVSEFVIARAILTDTLAVKLLGDFYARKPKSPTRLFKEEKEAMEWLMEQIDNYNKTRL
ncbi:MAG: hypothetical protein JWO32_1716 [Bacteroidetes bacterium]|nr:hypothetical protein [Bacteroidota bacterium]